MKKALGQECFLPGIFDKLFHKFIDVGQALSREPVPCL